MVAGSRLARRRRPGRLPAMDEGRAPDAVAAWLGIEVD
jgi:hypothetical protein